MIQQYSPRLCLNKIFLKFRGKVGYLTHVSFLETYVQADKRHNIDLGAIGSRSLSHARARFQCQLTFTIDQDMEGPVYVYYGLGKFYQNHRTYVKSRSFDQLKGGVSKQASRLFSWVVGSDIIGSDRFFVATVRVESTTNSATRVQSACCVSAPFACCAIALMALHTRIMLRSLPDTAMTDTTEGCR